ncbi:uncharacterized protein DNG_09971 [Cephalotrichum gorgonifer]|uniref:BTB domain-containing protein n=1 Tax=Cephalotrichum gorgonifer TaxID=2041049 RepID=A0AAE8T0G9_9PEZI|nr:uncharacterized protein DNG_09971 [Cephalotrichum gorgonifer]
MTEAIHVLDPQGDVLLTLDPNTTFLVFSNALTKASPYFKTCLEEPWNGSQTGRGGRRELEAGGWDEGAFLTVLRLIHGLNQDVPQKVDLTRMTKIAMVVDYYQCADAVSRFTSPWLISQHCRLWRVTSIQKLELWIFLAWVFKDHSTFKHATCNAAASLDRRFVTRRVPIPDGIVETINRDRLTYLSGRFAVLDNLLQELQQPESTLACSAECRSTLFSSLSEQMRGKGLFDRSACGDFERFSQANTWSLLRDFNDPQTCSPGNADGEGVSADTENVPCSLKKILKERFRDAPAPSPGLNLRQFMQYRGRDRWGDDHRAWEDSLWALPLDEPEPSVDTNHVQW